MAGTATLASAVGSGLSGSALAWEDAELVVEQGGECVPVTPLQSDEDVVDLYDYRPASDAENNQRSNLPSQLERGQTSRLFLYDGPEGFSLVVVHGGGDDEQGGAATFHVCGLSAEGEWVVLDDDYEGASDEFLLGNQEAVLNWGWGAGGRNDGAVYRGFPNSFCVTLRPWFDGDASLDPFGEGQVEAFQFLSGSLDDPDAIDLDPEKPLTIRTGGCGAETKGCVLSTRTISDPFTAEVTFCCTSVAVDADKYEWVRLNFLDGTDQRVDGPFEGLNAFVAESDGDGNGNNEIIRSVTIRRDGTKATVENPDADRCVGRVEDGEDEEEGTPAGS